MKRPGYAKMFFDYRSSHQGRGVDYHRTFSDIPHRAWMWSRESAILEEIVAGLSHRTSYLDFACGTGRVMSHVAPWFTRSVGVDVSESMLAVARRDNPSLKFLCADITIGDDVSGPFDFITAFRIFPNAEPELRLSSLHKLRKIISPSGTLVINNHLNYDALVMRVLRVLRKPYGYEAVPEEDITALARECGFEIESKYAIGRLPVVDHLNPLPIALVDILETGLSICPDSWASNIVYCLKPID